MTRFLSQNDTEREIKFFMICWILFAHLRSFTQFMKKIWPFSLVLLIVVWAICPAIGYFGQLWPHFERVKCLLKSEKPTHQFILTPENTADFKWVDAHEFWFDGQLFDVQKKEISGDSTRIFAHTDDFEKKLHEQFAGFFAKKNNPDAPQNVFWKIWQTHPFLVPVAYFELNLGNFLLKNRFLSEKEGWKNRTLLPVFLPPRG
jgi:hypothetical protein